MMNLQASLEINKGSKLFGIYLGCCGSFVYHLNKHNLGLIFEHFLRHAKICVFGNKTSCGMTQKDLWNNCRCIYRDSC